MANYYRPEGSGRKPNPLLADREWLYRHYIMEGLGGGAIAKLASCTPEAIYYWLRKHGIPARPDSEAVAAANIHRTGWKNPHDYSKTRNPNWRGGKLTVHCTYCGDDISLWPSQAKRSRHHFCNYSCKAKWCIGEKNSNWKGGISTDPGYSDEFNDELKEQIRNRDDYICQACGMTEADSQDRYGRVLTGHHIDYDKTNNEGSNLITLCVRCNALANTDREEHTRQFRRILELRHGYGKL